MKQKSVYLELKQYANPICLRPYPVPTVHEDFLTSELNAQFRWKYWKSQGTQSMETSTLYNLNQKNHVCFLSDFININIKIKSKLNPMPDINDMLLTLEGFKYAMPFDLNMGYYHIQ